MMKRKSLCQFKNRTTTVELYRRNTYQCEAITVYDLKQVSQLTEELKKNAVKSNQYIQIYPNFGMKIVRDVINKVRRLKRTKLY